MFKLDLERAEEPEIKSPTSIRSQKKQANSRKTSTSASLTKDFDSVDHNKLWKIHKVMGKITYLPPEKSVCRYRSNH